MKFSKVLPVAALLALVGASFSAQAYDADWKRGRVYYRSVCTSCHVAMPIDRSIRALRPRRNGQPTYRLTNTPRARTL